MSLVSPFGEGNDNSLQYSCLENFMDRGVWRATVYGVIKSQTWLSNFTFTLVKIMATSFKRSHAATYCYTHCSQPCSRPSLTHTSPLETPGHPWESQGQSLAGSLLLSPGSWCTQDSVCALQESISQSCVSSGRSIVGLIVTSSKRAYAIPNLLHPEPLSL